MSHYHQAMGKGGSVAYTFDLEVLVREVTVKGSKCIQLQKIGERKEHQFKFEVINSCLRGAADDLLLL